MGTENSLTSINDPFYSDQVGSQAATSTNDPNAAFYGVPPNPYYTTATATAPTPTPESTLPTIDFSVEEMQLMKEFLTALRTKRKQEQPLEDAIKDAVKELNG